jgi:hypothetical protein
MPDMILHYIKDHGWLPPWEFIDDVMNHDLVGGRRLQTKGPMPQPVQIGYLKGPYIQGLVPVGFVEKLEQLMCRVNELDYGYPVQYRRKGEE